MDCSPFMLFRFGVPAVRFLPQTQNTPDEWADVCLVRCKGVAQRLRVLHRFAGGGSPLTYLTDKALNGSGSLLIGFVALAGVSTPFPVASAPS